MQNVNTENSAEIKPNAPHSLLSPLSQSLSLSGVDCVKCIIVLLKEWKMCSKASSSSSRSKTHHVNKSAAKIRFGVRAMWGAFSSFAPPPTPHNPLGTLFKSLIGNQQSGRDMQFTIIINIPQVILSSRLSLSRPVKNELIKYILTRKKYGSAGRRRLDTDLIQNLRC